MKTNMLIAAALLAVGGSAYAWPVQTPTPVPVVNTGEVVVSTDANSWAGAYGANRADAAAQVFGAVDVTKSVPNGTSTPSVFRLGAEFAGIGVTKGAGQNTANANGGFRGTANWRFTTGQ